MLKRGSYKHELRVYAMFAGLLGCCFILSGCATYAQKTRSMRSDLLHGDFNAARALVEKMPDDNDALVELNKGMLRRLTGSYQASNIEFEKAKKRISALYGVSVSEQMGAVTINDAMRAYKGDRYEQVLLHAYMALNYIQLGRPYDARVEMLQADVKMREWGDHPQDDPFVRYLSGIIFEMLGENDQALVSYRQAYQAYRSERNRIGMNAPLIVKEDYLRLLATEGLDNEYRQMKQQFRLTNFKPTTIGKGMGEVVVILGNGLAPQRGQNVIQTFADTISSMVRIALPAYKHPPAVLMRPEVRVDGQDTAMQPVENIDAIARSALRSDMPVITARAIARAIVKHKTQKEVEKKEGGIAGLFMTVTNMATEHADTRSWTTLPQEIDVARLQLPAGQHTVHIDMVNAAGRVVDSIDQTVMVKPGQLQILGKRWIAPVPVVAASTQ